MKALSRIILVPVLLLINVSLLGQKGVPDDFCLSSEEYRLYELINAHRVINGLKEIPLSTSLCFVARTHVIDLYTHHPDTSICNLNSWSDKGDWTPCCHNKYIPAEDCIRNKPAELTNYTGEGYELTYAEVLNTSADTVFRFWKKIDQANEFLLNEASWERKNWRAMGVGIYKSYAVLWMGQRTDPAGAPELCEAMEKNAEPLNVVSSDGIELISTSTDRYYVIIASFQSEKDARKEAKKFSSQEGSTIKILKNNQGQFRISINDYPNLNAAKQGKSKYQGTFSGAWILNF